MSRVLTGGKSIVDAALWQIASRIVGATKFYDRIYGRAAKAIRGRIGAARGVGERRNGGEGVKETMKHTSYANRRRKSRESEDEVIPAPRSVLCIIYRSIDFDRTASRFLLSPPTLPLRVPDLITPRRASSRATRG